MLTAYRKTLPRRRSSTVRRTVLGPRFGPDSAGIRMTPEEYDTADAADFVNGYRYELIKGVLIVSPPPLVQESDPNEELGHWLRNYRDNHPNGRILDAALPQYAIRTRRNRRITDRAVFTGLGRAPRSEDIPTIVAEFVSAGKRNWLRDYEEKRDEYMEMGIRQYWVFNRFERTKTVFMKKGNSIVKRVLRGNRIFETDLLPGFELPLARLFAVADRYSENS